jgi:hypothetical protein
MEYKFICKTQSKKIILYSKIYDTPSDMISSVRSGVLFYNATNADKIIDVTVERDGSQKQQHLKIN